MRLYFALPHARPRSSRPACAAEAHAAAQLTSGLTPISNPDGANAAAIGIYHPKWDERPLLSIQPAEGENPTKEEIFAALEGKIAKWWTPDDIAFVDNIPLGATGKINKLALRDTFKDYKLPTA